MSHCAIFKLSFGLFLGFSVAVPGPEGDCPDLACESAELHEVMLLQVESAVGRIRRVAAVEAVDGERAISQEAAVAHSASARAALAQMPSYSAELVTEEAWPTIDAIATNEYEGHVGREECRQPLPEGDEHRPFEDVLAEHPNITGWCVYGYMGGWLSTCAAALEAQSYVGLAVQYGANTVHGTRDENALAQELGIGAPHDVLGYQGERFFTDYIYLAWDSQYCLDNGFLDQARFSVDAVHDYARMTEAADEYCLELLEEFPDMRQHAMSELMTFAGENQHILMDEATLPLGLRTLRRPVPWANRRHAAWKCVLGGLGCDISNCAYTYCLRDAPGGIGSFIGHGRQCREDWLPREDVQEYMDTIGSGASIP